MKIAVIGSKIIKPRNLSNFRAFQTTSNKKQNESAATVLHEDEVESEYASARPFSSIPGPKPLPIPYVGNYWRMLPFGTFGNLDLLGLQKKLYELYGPIVKLYGMGNFDQVFLFDAKSIEKMFRNDSIWPYRDPISCLKHYREVLRKDFYEDYPGLVTSNGEDWYKFRTATSKIMLNPKYVKSYHNSIGQVCDDFLERLRHIRQPNDEIPGDFTSELNKLSLESAALFSLDTRLGCLNNNLDPNSEEMKMIEKVKETITLLYKIDFEPSLSLFLPNRQWKNFVSGMDYCLEFSMKHINAKWEKIKEQKKEGEEESQSVLESLLLTTKNPKIPVVMATDIFFAGIDTTSSTLSAVLYNLATNPEKQEKLFQELKRVMPQKNTPLTEEKLGELKYARAALKESLRLTPTVGGNARTTVKDLVFNNYQIPKGTKLFAAHPTMCRMSKYFENPDQFIPERWLKSEKNSKISAANTNPFVHLPFGFGQRSCIGKRFAYLEMEMALSKIIRNFKVTYNDPEPMNWIVRIISTAARPLKFKLTERPE